jgi:hypothetical protein
LEVFVQVVATTWVISSIWIPDSSMAWRAAETERATPSVRNILEMSSIDGTVGCVKSGESHNTTEDRILMPV